MNVTIDTNQGKNAITQYAPGFFVINEHKVAENIVLTETNLIAWPNDTLSDPFDPQELQKIIKQTQPEIVIFGTGERMEPLSTDIVRKLMVNEVGFEVMDTGAACRTYNLLLGDSRRVTAILKVSPT